MAGEAEVKQKIVLEGEKEYNRAIKDAQRNLRTLRSELKMETAELGKNATEQQKNETKAKSLKKQIQEQEKVVQACQKAFDEVKQKYSDNAEAMATYEQKVNQARTTLANMRNALDGVSESFEEVGSEASTSLVETRSFAESIESLGNAADTVASSIEGIFTGMISATQQAISAVWSDITELAGRANAWSDLAGYWNTSTENVQKWYHAVQGSFNNFEDLNNAVTRIVMGDQKKIAEATGVSAAAYEDQWEYAMAVMDALSKMDYKSRTDAMGEIFGEKRATKVMDLVNDWGKIQALAKEFDVSSGGIGMDQEQMDTMATLAETVATIEQKWAAFKDSFTAGAFGKLSLDLAGDAQGMLDSLIAFMSADSQEERDQAISDLETHMKDFFTRLGEAITEASSVLDSVGEEMQGSENGGVRAVGTVLRAFSDVLDWFTDENNIDKVVHGFEALAAVWTGAKMVSAASTLASLAANVTTIKNGGGILSALLGRGGSPAADAATTAGNAATTAGSTATAAAGGTTRGWMTNWFGVAGVAAIVAGFRAAAAERLSNINIRGSEGAIQEAAGGDEKLMQAFETYIGAKNAMDAYAGGTEYDEAKAEAMVETLNEAQEAFFGMAGAWELMDKYSAWLQENGFGAMDGHVPEFMQEQEPQQEETETLTDALSQAQRDALEDWWDLMRRAPEDDLDSPVWDEFDTMWPELEALFSGNLGLLTELDKRLDGAAWGNGGDDWRSYEDIPASVFEGITTAGNDMNGASRSLDNATATMRGLPALLRAAVQSGVSNIVVTLDGQKVGSLITPYVSQGIAREIQ